MPSTRRVSLRAPARAAIAALRSWAVRRRGPSSTSVSPLAAASPQTRLQPSQQNCRSPSAPSAPVSTDLTGRPMTGRPHRSQERALTPAPVAAERDASF